MNNIWKWHKTLNNNTNRQDPIQVSDGSCPLPKEPSGSEGHVYLVCSATRSFYWTMRILRVRSWIEGPSTCMEILMDPSGADVSSLVVTFTIPVVKPNVHVMG